jgi:transposase
MTKDDRKAEGAEAVGRFAIALSECGGKIREACTKVGISYATGYRWWKDGLPSAGVEPLKGKYVTADAKGRVKRIARGEATAEEREALRGKMARVVDSRESEEGVIARADRVRDQEAKIVAMSRGAVLQMSATIIELGSASREMLGVLRSRIRTETEIARRWDEYKQARLTGAKVGKPDLPHPEMGVDATAGLLERVGKMVAKHGESVKVALEYERMLVGEPTTVIGLAAVPMRMSTVEARDRLLYLEALIDRAEASGGLEGDAPGLVKPVIGEVVTDL